jgi:hypothetical protein
MTSTTLIINLNLNLSVLSSLRPTSKAERYKCNIDASFSVQQNKVGKGYIRDDQGQFVLAKTERMSPITYTDIGEALGLPSALN